VSEGSRSTRLGAISPLARKLGIRPGLRVMLVCAPDSVEAALGTGAQAMGHQPGGQDVIVASCVWRAELERGLPGWASSLDPSGGLWIAWPKRASGGDTDLSDGLVRELGLAAGLVDNKVCAIDATWSALRFVYRLADRVR
jgi:hypothetical protein